MSRMRRLGIVSELKSGILLTVLALLLSVRTDLAQAFEFVDQPLSRDLVEGRTAILQCSVDDDTNIEFKWTLGGQDILSDDDRRTVTDGNLHIAGADRILDEGEFQCIATDTVTGESKTSAAAELNILWIQPAAKVTLKSPESLDLVEEGSRVTLNCKIDGNPAPDIEWYRDKQQLTANENVELTRNRLRLRSAQTDDSGTYSCHAQNRAGLAWSTGGNLTLTILDADFPVNVLAPEDVLVSVGDSAQFKCSFTGNPDPTIEWYFRGSETGNVVHLANGESTVISEDGTLLINDIMMSDEGTYICIGRSEVGQLDVEAKLTVAKVQDLPNLGFRIIPDGDPLSVNCTYPYGEDGGVPVPKISWLDPSGTPVSTDPSDRVHTEWSSLLVIKRLQESDNGNFTCKATNIAGEKTTPLGVIVATIPEFTKRPEDTSQKEKSDVWLDCQASGNPKPQIRWMMDDGSELQDERFTVYSNGTLHIRNLKLGDKGVYACRIATMAGSDVAKATLTVIPVLKFTPTPNGKVFELGDDSKIVCRASALTTPVVRWFKLPGQLSSWDSHINETDGKLDFRPAKMSDSGQYMCVATAGSEIINITVTINVFVRPKFSVRPKNTTGYEGYPLTIDCQATGNPQPIISWVGLSPSKVEAPHMTKLSNGSLYVDEVRLSDAGNYQCIAGSDAGLSSAEIILTVRKGVPPGSVPVAPQLMIRTIAIAVGCALAYIILVVGLMWWCRQRRRKQRRLMKEEAEAAEMAALQGGSGGQVAKVNGSLPHPPPPGAVPYPAEDQKAAGMSNGDIALNPMMKGAAGRRGSYDKLQFPRHDLQTLVVIGHGSYGEVFLARAAGITEGVEATTVMVKALHSKNEAQQMDFRREMDMLSKLNHENIVKLLGMCREAEPQLMITEYLEWGDLKQYLHATRGENGTTNVPPPLTLAQKLDVINQVALGMEHLASHRFIHGDLAARNCLLSPAMETKISLMGVSRDLYRTEYHEYKQKLVPIRWMPAEAIFEDELSTKSDVWAYSVFVWEVFSQGELPYKKLDNDALMRVLLDGVMLETPTGTPDEVEILMHRCWAESPKERYSFSDIVLALQNVTPDSSV